MDFLELPTSGTYYINEDKGEDNSENNFFENDKIFNISHEILLKKQKNKELYLKKKRLIEIIKKLSKDEHIEIFKIFLEDNISYSENNNGIFINLNNVKDKTLDNILKYAEYIEVKKNDLFMDDVKTEEKKELLGNSLKVVVNNFELNKTIYKEYEFQDNHEKIMNEKINEYLKDIDTKDIDPSKISLKRKKNKYHGNMAKLINSFKEAKEPNPQKYNNSHKSYSEEK
jgi:hypothetical protein